MNYSIPSRILYTLSVIICSVGMVKAQLKNDYPIQPVAFTQVHVMDNFWAPKIKVNADVTIPYTLEQCKKTGRIDNFLMAAGVMKGDKTSHYTFDDTDLYKILEGASYSLQVRKNPELERYIDTLISYIAAAQEPDGYLYTFRSIKTDHPHEWMGKKRWEKEEDLSHELYNAGHLYEAAVAHFQATGKRSLLNVAIRNADLLVKTFGWGKEEKFPGHQIVETGLAKMYRVTGNRSYLDLAKFFLDLRGKPGHLNQEYSQSHIPVVDQHTAVGHAVRATYMYTGMADVAALTGDKQYLSAIDDIWNDVTDKKLYITGGIGATGNGEAFGDPYDLPNMSAYAETCAAIANVYWNSRMFLLHGDAKYIDVLERTLYNGLLSGISLSGDKFFYPNPLASLGQNQRRGWWDCACCVSNLTRFLPSMPGYVYAQDGSNLYVNLFVGSVSVIKLPSVNVSITQQTNYPWEGKTEMIVNPDRNAVFTLHIRIPGWAKGQPSAGGLYTTSDEGNRQVRLLINGKPVDLHLTKGYAVIEREWKRGDRVMLDLPLEVEKVMAKDSVKADRNRFALQRGPLVYCLEGPDNFDSTVMNIVVDKNASVTVSYQPNMLQGVARLEMDGYSVRRQTGSEELIRNAAKVRAIPYYAWANRGPSEMEVWIPYTASAARPRPAPSIASRSRVSASVNSPLMLRAINDQYEPQDSKDPSASYLHWWPKKNTTEWVQYDFDSVHTVSQSSVYWFDDGPWGGCRVPLSWKLYYKSEGQWLPVKALSEYIVSKDKYDTIRFEPVQTSAMKIEVQLPVDFATGMHEWIIK